MGKKILFAVMALLVMATGKIWAEGETTEQKPKAYAVLYQNTEKAIGSLHFMYTNVIPTEKTVDVTINGTTTSIKLTATNHWEITDDWSCGWQAPATSLEFSMFSKITRVVFEDSFKAVKVKKCNNWFEGFTSLAEIVGIENLNTSAVTDMARMFYSCNALKSLNLSSFNTSAVTDMECMFYGCNKLESLDLSSFNTSSVTDMSDMFNGCSKLESLDLSSFNTSMVTKMRNMFNGCISLNNLTLGSFDMTREERVNNKNDMFDNSNITIRGNNVLVFVKSDAQKGVWEGFTGVNLMVKKNGADKYVSDGTVDITLDNDKDTPVIFPHNFIANSVTFKRTFTKGNPHTVCLPFAITNTAGYGTFYELSGYDNGKVKFKKVDKTEANTPYLLIPNTDGVTTIKVTGNVDISSTTGGGNAIADDYNTRFRGVYEKFTFTEEYLKTNSNYDYYGWTAAGDFKKATAGASVGPCRAYIILTKGGAGIGSAPARLSVEFDDGETTGIDTIGTADGGADAPMYNLQGQRVGSGYKGVVIKNGKKMIVK